METAIQKMNIVHIIPTLSTGGAEQFVINLANELSNEHNITIITMFSSNSDIVKNRLQPAVKLFELKIPLKNKLLAIVRMHALLSKIDSDVVHTHLSSPLYMLFYAILNRKKRKFIHTVHNIAEYDAPRKFNRYVNEIYFRLCGAHPISITKKVSDSVKIYYHIKESRVIHNGTSVFSLSDKCTIVLEQIRNIKKKYALVLCHIARMDPQKNHKLLLEMLRMQPDCYVISMGSITKDNEKYANAILSESNDLNNFEYIGVKDNVADYINACDGIIYSSHYEGLPISLIESMSFGKVCISTPAGGITDVLNNDIGIVSNSFKVNDFKDAVEKFIFLKDKERKELETRILKKFHKNYSIENCAKSYLEVYKRSFL